MTSSGGRADLGVGAALLLFCGVVFWRTTTFPEVPAMLSQNVPPTFFPRLVLAAIVLLTLLVLVRGGKEEKQERESVGTPVLATAAAMIATVALIPRLGTFATIGLASAGFAFLWGERRRLRIGLLALGIPLSVYVVFVLALDMRFPRGVLP